MEAFYTALQDPSTTSTTKTAYTIWREKHPTDRRNIDANKLANVKRDIMKQKRLTDLELATIQEKTKPNISDTSIEHLDEDRPEGTTPAVEELDEHQEAIQEEPENERLLDMVGNIRQKWETIKETPLGERPPIPKIKKDRTAKQTIKCANAAIHHIKGIMTHPMDLTEINQLTYATASVIAETLGERPRKQKQARKQPAWKEKIEKEVKKLRADLSLLSEIEKGSTVKERKVKQMKRKLNIKKWEDIPAAKENLKQKMQAKAQRLRRFTKRSNFFRQNKTFKEDAKKFYRELGKKKIDVNEPPTIEEVEEFWSKIWENNKTHNDQATWIQQEQDKHKNLMSQEWSEINITETTASINKTNNWKAPGIDGVANFWIKHLPSIHEDLARAFTNIIENPADCPRWLTQGITYLLPKTEETQNPKNYRPITCLPTMYKILTSIITERTYTFLDQNNLLPAEQKGCRKGSYGCKDQLLINKAILEEAKSKKKNLSTAWIDYKKAFDSVPHTWIEKCLEIYRVCPTTIKFIVQSMKNWKTTLNLHHTNGSLTSRPINIKSGIFQGDSLSPLLFCLALAPLSTLLNRSNYGYESQNGKVNHLFYMDDLKTFTRDDNQQTGLLTIVKTFSDDIRMEFGLDKCAKATFKSGRLTQTTNIDLDIDTVIKEIDQEGTYKYLGVNEGDGIQHATMKEKIRREYYRRVRMVLKSELNAANRFEAINTLAIPVVTYSFNIINWKLSDIKRLDTKTRKMLTMEKMHHPKADVDRLYLPRAEGGRGLAQLELTFKTTTIGLDTYLTSTEDPLLLLVKHHEHRKKLFSIKKEAAKFKQELNLPEITPTENEATTKYARRVKVKAKQHGQLQMHKTWEEKAMHGKYPKRIKDADVDQVKTNKWLKAHGLKAETEGLIIAAQDQSLATRSFHHRIIKDGTDPQCRICGKHEESIDHIISGCSELAKTEYIQRHNKAAAYLHWKICREYKIKTADKWYEHQPGTVTGNDEITILWDMPIQTDREIKANRPDIVIKNKITKECILIDMAIPSERNTSVKVTEKLSKYKDLELDINRMWGMKTTTIPVVIGALGLVKKGLEKYTDKIPGNINIHEVQKIALLGTAHILRRVLSIK